MDFFDKDDGFVELVNKISISEIVKNPINFRIDLNAAALQVEEDMMEDENKHEEINNEKSWDKTFDELKISMEKCLTVKTLNDNEVVHIYKRIIKKGDGERMACQRYNIEFSYQMYFESEQTPFDSSFWKNSTVQTACADELLPGIWYSLETMQKGEEAEFIIDRKLMFGNMGVPLEFYKENKKNADVLLIAKLVNFIDVGDEIINEIDNLQQFDIVQANAIDAKKRANDLFNHGLFQQAIRINHRAIQCLNFCPIDNDDNQKARDELLVEFYTLLIHCYDKIENWKKSLSTIDCLNQLSNIENNVEILVKKAIAMSNIDDNYDESIKILRNAQLICPTDATVSSTLADIIVKHAKYKADRKMLWQRAFQIKTHTNKETDEEFKAKFSEMMKSFKKSDTNVPLLGYTKNELKLIEELLDGQSMWKLQKGKNFHGQDEYKMMKQADDN